LARVRLPWSAPMSKSQNMTLGHEERGSNGIVQRLVRPGVSSDTLETEGIRYVTAKEAKQLLGQSVAGILIPYRIKVNGRDFFRLRLEKPTDDRKYTQAYQSGVHGYVPLLFQKVRKVKIGQDWWLFIAEGEFKALSMLEAGYPTVGAGGIQNCLKKWDKEGDRELIAEFAELVGADKPKGIAFVGDADTALIPDFSKAMVRLANAIKLPLILPRIPVDAPGKGIDDCREVLKGEFNGWFDRIVDQAVKVNVELAPAALALELLSREVTALKTLTDKTPVTRENALARSIKLAAGYFKDNDAREHIIDIASEVFGMPADEFRQKAAQTRQENADKYKAEMAVKAGRAMATKVRVPANSPANVANNGLVPTPCDWFAQTFPALPEKFGDALLEHHPKDPTKLPSVTALNEDFLAATLGKDGSPTEPAVFIPVEGKFYQYAAHDGIFRVKAPEDLEGKISATLLACARACALGADVRSLEFGFRKSSVLHGVSRRARALLLEKNDFFDATVKDFIACNDCMLRVTDLQPQPFSPDYHRRNKLGINFVPDAKCERFLNELMRPAMSEADLDLIQRWSGMALLGENLAQKLMLLVGTAGGGKGTFIRVLSGIIGLENLGELRTKHLERSRFELSLLAGKTLLYGGDVASDFLNEEGASGLKKITGGDPISPEHKNSGMTRTIECRFNVIVSANCRLQVRLEKDAEAWRRRLVIISYARSATGNPIADFDKVLLRDEGSGILNWMLAGLKKLEADGWRLKLNDEQQARVDALLLESDSIMVFTRDRLYKDPNLTVTVSDAFDDYTEYCQQRDWTAVTRYEFGSKIERAVSAQFGVAIRHDVMDCNLRAQRGWKGIGLQ